MTRITIKMRYKNGRPNLVIAHPPGTLKDYPFSIPQYKESYTDFAKLAESKFNVFFVRGKKRNYLGRGIFAKGFLFKKDRFIKYDKKIPARVIYNKTTVYANGGKNWDIVNKWNLYKITGNKYTTYKFFKKFMKHTYRIRSKADYDKYIKKITTKRVAFKPVRGAEGKGIIISYKGESAHRMRKYIFKKTKKSSRKGKYDGILQEFINTSEGIPGLYHGYHDMRILIMDGKIIQTYIRIPKKGHYRANIAQGGRMKEIKKSQVPVSAIRIAKKIDTKLKKFGHRVYAVDFGFEKGRPYLFEINPQPGLPYKAWSMYYKTWHQELLKILVKAAKI